MPTKMRTDKMAETLTPIVTRVANDEELRAHAKTALDSAKVIYAKIQADGPRKAATSRAVTDEVMKAAGELKVAAARLSDKPAKTRRKFGRLLIGGSDHTLRVQQGTCWTAGCHEAVHGSSVSPSLRF